MASALLFLAFLLFLAPTYLRDVSLPPRTLTHSSALFGQVALSESLSHLPRIAVPFSVVTFLYSLLLAFLSSVTLCLPHQTRL